MAPAASYKGLRPSSSRASEAARASSRKRDTKCELLLRRALWSAGCRYRTDVRALPGRPDILFSKVRIAIFCDGDFWHGRNWEQRSAKLEGGHNAAYWLKKIGGNMERDRKNTALLQSDGWTVLRFWETDIRKDTDGIASQILAALDRAGHRKASRTGAS